MAKGQMRSNKETKKPKKEKTTAPVANTFNSQVKTAETGKQK